MNKILYRLGNNTFTSEELVKAFLHELSLIHRRDHLIARVILETFARIHDVLSLRIEDIGSIDNVISFQRTAKHYSVSVSEDLIIDLLKYIKETSDRRGKSDYVFITTTGKIVTRARLNYTFQRIGAKFIPSLDINPEFLRDIGWAIQMFEPELLK